MRILFLSPRQCWPARSGAKLREYHFLRALALHADVTYAYFVDPGSSPLTRDDLRFCRQIVGIPKPSAYAAGQLLKGIAGRLPLPILNYSSPEMSSAVERLLAEAPYDIAHLDSIHMIRYAEILRARSSASIVYNWHNIESEAMRRYSKTVKSPPRRWYARQTAGKLKQCEREILRAAAGHVVCSERERQQLLHWCPDARVAAIDNGVDVAYFAGAGAPSESAGPRNLVFVGSMDYFPNAEAMTSFCHGVWPQVREKISESHLWIVGANPGPDVQALGQIPGVTVTGTVPDVRPYYQNALTAIVPLRTGGGTRLKILEAMAAGVPVISTPLGAEGLDVSPGKNILLAAPGDPEQWTNYLLRLAEPSLVDASSADQSNDMRRQIVNEGLELVKSRYDWEALGLLLWNTYQGWLGSKT